VRVERAPLAEVQAPDWDGTLAELGCSDVYFSRAYVETTCLLEPGRPVLLLCADAEGAVALPLILRDVPGGAGDLDVTTPYGYGGPVVSGSAPPVARFWERYTDWCRERGVVTTFVRFHPLLRNETAGGPLRLEALAGTVAWRLDGDLPTGVHRHHRRLIRKAHAAGVETRVEEGPADLAGFRRLYEETMRSRDAAPFYFFGDAYWSALAGPLRERTVLVDALVGRRTVASVLLLASPPWLHYHLGASAADAGAQGAPHAALLAAAEYGQREGYEHLHLGGGVGGRRDSLLEYKLRFAPASLIPAFVGKYVNDRRRYRELAGADAGVDGFFPRYRR
jgi:hypothetical protein